MNKQIAAAMAVAMAVFLTAACIGASAESADAAGPYEFTVDYEGGYSISYYASEQASEGVKGTAYITNVTINEGSTDVELELPEIVTRSDNGYAGYVYDITGIGTEGYAMVVFSTEDGATKIKSITMPDSYTWLTSSAFSNCSNLESVKLSSSLKSIGEKTFSGTKISSIEIPESVETIGYRAFYGCADLDEVIIPSGVTSIGEDAFRFTGLTSVEIESADQSIERSIGKGAFAANSSLETISIPEGFTKISDNAFQNCRSITKVTIPSTVNEMWNNVFDGCSSLVTVTFEGDTEFKGSSIFKNCIALENVELHEGMSGYTIQQFSGCTSLKEVVISEGFTKIDRSMFNGCTSLTDITIPASVTSVDDEAFSGCDSLETVTFIGTEPPDISNDTFGTNTKFIIPDGSEEEYQTVLNTATGGTASVSTYVAKVGDNVFSTLGEAISATPVDGTNTFVELIADTVLDSTIYIRDGRSITLDLNGKDITWSGSPSSPVISVVSTLSVIGGGSIDAGTGDSEASAALWNNGKGVLTVDDGVKLVNGNQATVYNVGKLTLGDVTIENANGDGTSFHIPVYTTSNESFKSNTIIDGATITNNGSTAAVYGNGTLEIRDGTIAGGSNAVMVYGGSTTISGGTISAPEVAVNVGNGSLTVTGGTISSDSGNQCIQVSDLNQGTASVSGGSFSSEIPDEYISADSALVSDGEGGYTAVSGDDIDISGDGSYTMSDGQTLVSNGGHSVTIQYSGSVADIVFEGTTSKGEVSIEVSVVSNPHFASEGATYAILIQYENLEPESASVTVTVPMGSDQYLSGCVVRYYDSVESSEGYISSEMVNFSEDGTVTFVTEHSTEYDLIPTFGIIESDRPVTVPDDDDLPPFIPTQPEDDDSVTIIACAAAAVVAALMAVFLILTYRKD